MNSFKPLKPLPSPLHPPEPEEEKSMLELLEKPGNLDLAKEKLIQMLQNGRFSEELWALYLETLLIEKETNQELLSSDLLEIFPYVASVAKSGGVKLSPSFLWRWGLTHYAIGLQGEEPWDFVRSISLLKRAISFGMERGSLCFDLAKCYFFLQRLLKDRSYLEEAIRWLERGERLTGGIQEEMLPLFRVISLSLFQESPSEELLNWSIRFFTPEMPNEGVEEWVEKGRYYLNAARFKGDLALYQKALEQFQKAEAVGYDSAEMTLMLGETFLGMGADGERIDLLREGQNLLEYVADLHPENNRPLELLAEGYFEEGSFLQDQSLIELACDAYFEALSVDPTSGDGYWGLARALTLLGELKGDIVSIQRASWFFAESEYHLKDKTPLFYADWGFCLLKFAELTQDNAYVSLAIIRLEQALKTLGNDAPPSEWLYHLGCAYDLLGDQTMQISDYEKAIYFLTRAMTAEPPHPYVRFNLASALSHLGEATNEPECFEKAFELFRTQAEKDPEDDVVFAEWGVSLLSFAELVDDPSLPTRKEAVFREAEDRLEWARRHGNLHASYHLACLHSLQGNLDAANHFLERADVMGVLPPPDELIEDEWLDAVQATPQFEALIARIKSKKKTS